MEILNRKQVILNKESNSSKYVQASINSDGHLVIREWFDEMIDEPFEKTSTCKNCNKKIIWNDEGLYWAHAETSECDNPKPADKIHYFEPDEKLIILNAEETEAVVNFVLKYVKEQKQKDNRRLW